MKRFNSYLSKATCCMVLLLPLAFIGAGQAVAAPAAANVNVVNTPNVNVVNTPLLVGSVDNPASQPFQAQVPFTINPPNIGITLTVAVVPAAKRLVIEHATVSAGGAPTGHMGARLTTSAGGVEAAHHLLLIEQSDAYNASTYFTTSQPIRVYADPNSAPTIIVFRGDPTVITAGSVSISGHFVDIP